MSRAFEIRSDDDYARSTDRGLIHAFLSTLPNVQMLSRNFGEYEVPAADLYTTIDLALYDEDGNFLDLDEPGREDENRVNAVQLHIAAGHADKDRMHYYEALGMTIARHLGWRLYAVGQGYIDTNSS